MEEPGFEIPRGGTGAVNSSREEGAGGNMSQVQESMYIRK